MSLRAPLAGLSAAAALTIGIATDGAASKVLLFVGGAAGAAAVLQRTNSKEEINRQRRVAEDINVIKIKVLDIEPLDYKKITEQILSEIKREDFNLPYISTARSAYTLTTDQSSLEESGKPSDGQIEKREVVEATDEQSTIFTTFGKLTAFGMSWSRETAEWSSQPNLLGTKLNDERISINLNQQYGVYFLHDKLEIKHVEHTKGRSLSQSIYEHHRTNSPSASWDRFSWFSLTSVSSNDNHIKLEQTLAAILIKVLELRQDREVVDDLAEVEYEQNQVGQS